ncbi:hypothetical protein K8T06_08190, partial [bacterium]|nr:hypothetical protein [bacterium]
MAKPSDEPDKIILQIEEALIRNDLVRASALMESISNRSLLSNNRLQELVRQIRLVQENRESLDRTLLKAEHLLENNDPDQAIPLFQRVIEASPDHSKARIGLQNSRRKIDYRHRINLFIETIRRAREKEDYRTAREYCSEWLQLDPENEKAREIFQDLDRLLNRDREVLVMKNRGSELIDLGRYQEAIDLL